MLHFIVFKTLLGFQLS